MAFRIRRLYSMSVRILMSTFLTIQDILNSDHQTKIEQHDTYNVVILKLLFSNDDGYVPQQIAIVQGGNYLLTFYGKGNRLSEWYKYGIGKECVENT